MEGRGGQAVGSRPDATRRGAPTHPLAAAVKPGGRNDPSLDNGAAESETVAVEKNTTFVGYRDDGRDR